MQPSTTSQPTPPPVVPVPKPSTQAPKKKQPGLVIALVALVVVAIGTGAYLLWSNMQNPSSDVAEAAKVNIVADGFTPQTVKVQKGQSVTWTNTDVAPHHIAADDASLTLNSGDSLQQGESFTYIFDQAGTFTYHDAANSTDSFKGTVIVE